MSVCRRAGGHIPGAVLAVLLLAVSISADAQTAYEYKVLANNLCQAGAPALDETGQVAFAYATSPSLCPELSPDAQIIRANVGELTKIFGIAGQTEFRSLNLLEASLDEAGTVVFQAARPSGAAVILAGSGGPVTVIADTTPPRPPGFPFTSVTRPRNHRNSGPVAFQANLEGQSGEFVIRASAGVYQLVAGGGTVVPGHGTLFGAQMQATNAAGVLFTGGAGPNIGLIYWNGMSYTLIAPRVSSAANSINDLGVATWVTDGQLLKGSGGTPTVVASALPGGAYADISAQAINDAGRVVFRARLTPTAPFGVYSGPNPVADKILGPGDIVPGLGTVRTVDIGTMALNDAGQIAMAVFYDPGDGSTKSAIVRADPLIAPSTDLVLKMTAAPNPVLPSGTLTYTLTLTNAGGETASSILVTDTLPGTVTLTSCAATNGGVCGGAGNARTISYGSLAPGASSTITIVAAVSASAGAGTAISSTATVSSATADPVLANNTAAANVSTPTLTPGGDADADGLLNDFETRYGLNPFAGGDDGAGGDPDADGRTNLQEQQDGTHPRGFVITHLAEGATGAFFDTRLAVANPTSQAALVLTRFQKSDGTVIRDYRVLPPMQRTTIDVETLAGLEAAEFSTLIEADVQVVADRTMTWDQAGYGSHAERGILTRTATKWYFAEGATFFNFNLFYLIQNPNTQAAQVRVTYLLPTGSPLVKDYVVGQQSRFNIWVDNEGLTDPALARLANAELSAVIESTNGVPIIAERAMYLDQPGRALGAGHESAGVTSPATQWFLAEGATGSFFDLFILIANPQPTAANVQADFLLTSGQLITKTYTVAGNSRFNIWVDLEDPRLADAALSTRITSTNEVPIIVERAMWWPGPTPDTWQEAHNSPGEVTTGARWAIAEGEVGGSRKTQTYVLIANTSAFDGTARVTVLFEDGTAPVSRNFPLTANSRSNVVPEADFPETIGKRFGMLIESLGGTPAQIVVERAMYSDSGGVPWAAGTNALATKLP